MSEKTDSVWDQSRLDFEMPRGLPRPLFKGLPVPYTVGLEGDLYVGDMLHHVEGAPVEPSFSSLDIDRHLECHRDLCCLVCGEEVEGECSLVVDLEDGTGYVADEAPMHVRCGKMAMRHCPHLRDRPERYELRLGSVSDLKEAWAGDARRVAPASFKALKALQAAEGSEEPAAGVAAGATVTS